jgi:hypothetical protein
LQKSEGLGVVVADPATLVSLGGCPKANQVSFYAPRNTSAAAICKVRKRYLRGRTGRGGAWARGGGPSAVASNAAGPRRQPAVPTSPRIHPSRVGCL